MSLLGSSFPFHDFLVYFDGYYFCTNCSEFVEPTSGVILNYNESAISFFDSCIVVNKKQTAKCSKCKKTSALNISENYYEKISVVDKGKEFHILSRGCNARLFANIEIVDSVSEPSNFSFTSFTTDTLPITFESYTLKDIDVLSLFEILKKENSNHPVKVMFDRQNFFGFIIDKNTKDVYYKIGDKKVLLTEDVIPSSIFSELIELCLNY